MKIFLYYCKKSFFLSLNPLSMSHLFLSHSFIAKTNSPKENIVNNIHPSLSFRYFSLLFSETPSIKISPCVGLSYPAKIFIRVLFPAPFGPISPIIDGVLIVMIMSKLIL